jgi:hypothetical protein
VDAGLPQEGLGGPVEGEGQRAVAEDAGPFALFRFLWLLARPLLLLLLLLFAWRRRRFCFWLLLQRSGGSGIRKMDESS